jgi:hypothetical protein
VEGESCSIADGGFGGGWKVDVHVVNPLIFLWNLIWLDLLQ